MQGTVAPTISREINCSFATLTIGRGRFGGYCFECSDEFTDIKKFKRAAKKLWNQRKVHLYGRKERALHHVQQCGRQNPWSPAKCVQCNCLTVNNAPEKSRRPRPRCTSAWLTCPPQNWKCGEALVMQIKLHKYSKFPTLKKKLCAKFSARKFKYGHSCNKNRNAENWFWLALSCAFLPEPTLHSIFFQFRLPYDWWYGMYIFQFLTPIAPIVLKQNAPAHIYIHSLVNESSILSDFWLGLRKWCEKQGVKTKEVNIHINEIMMSFTSGI